MAPHVVILGVFVADLSVRAGRQPKMGETVIGNDFTIGPGGKGSNQAVAVARLGVESSIISRLGRDDFAAMALNLWRQEGVNAVIEESDDSYTGAASIFVEAETGNNAIIICPGAAAAISPAQLERAAPVIQAASVFITQCEQPMEAAMTGLSIARRAQVTTILNPAPAVTMADSIFAQCDFVTPNESEAEAITGLPVTGLEEARKAAAWFCAHGAGAAIITLGAMGVLYQDPHQSVHIPAINAGPVVETTGAGDAFNGGFAAAIAQGRDPLAACRYGCAVAGISVTRKGTAPSMPSAAEVAAMVA